MKIIVAVLALCAFAQNAFAASPECRAVEGNSARLACYDAAQPPKIATPKEISREISKEKPRAIESDALRPEYKDPFLAENARTTSKLNNICRGC
ncbi:hypothetical protein JQ629_06735 [Bradyrhizobium sp. AUGA SZCCT0222]|uniref:hypothetical protein n=1 Tax=Bradyrhizobium sp. AUGA SZCCT0222 TaxID=2807668 RepID=UPI001BA9056E|nr:hypothetical protein [Bradyrhizobium sp. AUGA SZCCT0222]MBR1267202.1 hypothetical protein [Bradyrhizobium sp. AUGA SZCCT0222]